MDFYHEYIVLSKQDAEAINNYLESVGIAPVQFLDCPTSGLGSNYSGMKYTTPDVFFGIDGFAYNTEDPDYDEDFSVYAFSFKTVYFTFSNQIGAGV